MSLQYQAFAYTLSITIPDRLAPYATMLLTDHEPAMAVPCSAWTMEPSCIISTEHVRRWPPLLHRRLGAHLPHFDLATAVLPPPHPRRPASRVGAISVATIDINLVGAPFSTVNELGTPKVASFP